jgi:DNA repair exonuclease SbcCD ATPase subunit
MEPMEFEQIIKRLDWLDEEHRKDKAELDALMEKLANVQGELRVANKKIKELNTELSQFSTVLARIDQFNSIIDQQRVDILKYVDVLDNKNVGKLPEAEKRFQIQIDNINKSIIDLRKNKGMIDEIKRELKNYAAEDARINNLMSEWEPRFQDITKTIEDIQHVQKTSEGSRLRESKRLSELQGAVNAARKRMDEIREKNDLFPDTIRRLETRLNELLASEAERRQSQTNFVESQARLQIDRDRTLKEMEEYLGTIRTQTGTIDRQLQELDGVQRAAKRAKDAYDEIVQKYERRINEITEMQRLAEDRFRQEWVTFKADDQKRWTSHTLSQDEIHKDARSSAEKLEERLVILEDLVQSQQDVLQQTKEANEQLFQGMLAQIHELLSAYERIMSTK